MAAAEHVQPRLRNEPVHHPGVDQRDDGVIVARDDERGLSQQRQERHAGPADPGGDLVGIAARRADPVVAFQSRGDPGRITAGAATVQIRRDAIQVAGVGVPLAGQ
jgi:hypothetical protein